MLSDHEKTWENFDQKILTERSIDLKGIPFGWTEDGAIIFRDGNREYLVIFPFGPDRWIRIYIETPERHGPAPIYISYLIGDREEIAESARGFAAMEIWCGKGYAQELGIVDEDGRVIPLEEDEPKEDEDNGHKEAV